MVVARRGLSVARNGDLRSYTTGVVLSKLFTSVKGTILNKRKLFVKFDEINEKWSDILLFTPTEGDCRTISRISL